MIQLGDRAKDTITGFTGIVVAITEWLHGCRRIVIQPEKLHEGKVPEVVTFDEPQCELIKSMGHTPIRATGGPRPNPVKR